MGIIIGLDIGGSNTKIVGLNNEIVFDYQMSSATDPVASAFGALGKFLDVNQLRIADVECLKVTGVGANFPHGDLLGIPTIRLQEFLATGLGGLYLSSLQQAIVVSMGTGTAFIEARDNRVKHIIGSGVGGGAILGLASKLLQIRDFETITELSSRGDLSHIDLTIGDISAVEIPGLSMETTASNFGKITDSATREDMALGVINMVFQTIGTMSVLAARNVNLSDVVLTGHMTESPCCGAVFSSFSDLYQIRFHIPERAMYATAIGAAISGEKQE